MRSVKAYSLILFGLTTVVALVILVATGTLATTATASSSNDFSTIPDSSNDLAPLNRISNQPVAAGGFSLTPLPFGDTCYTNPIFICRDYTYEFCQQNNPKTCYQFSAAPSGGLVGHAINVVSMHNPDGSWTFAALDPQVFSTADPSFIATWSQPANDSTPDPSVANFPTTAIDAYMDRTLNVSVATQYSFHVVVGTTPYLQATSILAILLGTQYPGYWANGVYPLNLLAGVINIMSNYNYQIGPNRTPPVATCSSLVGKPDSSFPINQALSPVFTYSSVSSNLSSNEASQLDLGTADVVAPYTISDGQGGTSNDPLAEWPSTVCIGTNTEPQAPQAVADIDGTWQLIDTSQAPLPHPPESLIASMSNQSSGPILTNSMVNLSVTATVGAFANWAANNTASQDTIKVAFQINGNGISETLTNTNGNSSASAANPTTGSFPYQFSNVDLSKLALEGGTYNITATVSVYDSNSNLLARYHSLPTPIAISVPITTTVISADGTPVTAVSPTDTVSLNFTSPYSVVVPAGDTLAAFPTITGPDVDGEGLVNANNNYTSATNLPITVQGVNLSQVALQTGTTYTISAMINMFNSSGTFVSSYQSIPVSIIVSPPLTVSILSGGTSVSSVSPTDTVNLHLTSLPQDSVIPQGDSANTHFYISGPDLSSTILSDGNGDSHVSGTSLPMNLQGVGLSQVSLEPGSTYQVYAKFNVLSPTGTVYSSYESAPAPLVVSGPTFTVNMTNAGGALTQSASPSDTLNLQVTSSTTFTPPPNDTFRAHFYISGSNLGSTGLTGASGVGNIAGTTFPLTLQGVGLSQVSLSTNTTYSIFAKITILNSSGVPDPSLTTNSFQTPSTSLTINPTPPDCQVSNVYYSPSNALTASGDNNYKYSFYYRYTWSSGAYVPEYNGEEEVNYNNVYNAVTGQLIGQVANTTGVCSNDPNPSVENYPYSTNNLNPYASLPACPFPYAQAAAEPNFSTFTCPSTPTTPASPPPSQQPEACFEYSSDGLTDTYYQCTFTPSTGAVSGCQLSIKSGTPLCSSL